MQYPNLVTVNHASNRSYDSKRDSQRTNKRSCLFVM